jgi:hypothetical protein
MESLTGFELVLQYKTPIGAMFTLHVLILFFLFIIFCYLLFTVFYFFFLFLMAAPRNLMYEAIFPVAFLKIQETPVTAVYE